jgi:ABC-type bacteriocin/lantibiotic exporter with double-glycine peptidase domain
MDNKKLIIASALTIIISVLVNLVIFNMIFIKKNDPRISASAVNQAASGQTLNHAKAGNASTSANNLIMENIKTVTGQAANESFQPIINNNNISGVATGTQPGLNQAGNPSPNTVVIPASGDFQKEMNSVRK